MPNGPRKASLRAPTTTERIKSGLQDALGIPEALWGIPMPDRTIEATRDLADARAAKGPVIRPSTTLEKIRDTLAPVTKVAEFLGDPLSNAEMGPAKAITLVTKRPMLDLLKKLHPRNAAGMLIDPEEFPRITDAVGEVVTRHPRVASHLNSIDMSLAGQELGKFVSPNQFGKQIQSMGADAYRRNWDAPIGKIELNPLIETLQLRGSPIDTLTHEFAHAAQFIADPRRFSPTYDHAGKVVSSNASKMEHLLFPNPGYQYNPAEIAARAAGFRGMERSMGARPTNYRKAVSREADHHGELDEIANTWKSARGAYEKWAADRGISIKPRL